MKLTKVHITNFRSVQDSTEFEIGDVSCLVGKNEAGKTALLQALYRLNPINEEDGDFNEIHDYPRQKFSKYRRDVSSGQQDAARVVQATYALEHDDINEIKQLFGGNWPKVEHLNLVLEIRYNSTVTPSLDLDKKAATEHLVRNANLSKSLEDELSNQTIEVMLETLSNAEQTHEVGQISSTLEKIYSDGFSCFVYDQILSARVPKFLYFNEYYQMKGEDNLQALIERRNNNSLEKSDYPLLGLIALAGLDLDQLNNLAETEDLVSELGAAETELTETVLSYWSQNQHLRMKFDVRAALPNDPPGMTEGVNIWGRMVDTKHNVETRLGTRSRGFVWFFSFLAWYSQLQREGKSLILLLDEPGLSLHAKAQGDLLRYFEEQLKPHHQLIYTTHSPFMVDPVHFDRVRIVQDLSIEPNYEKLSVEKQGTKVVTDILKATRDSLFPLQGALGYDIYQTLFVGPNCLVVEGVSDLLYIQTISALLQTQSKQSLSAEWTITPVGGSDKVPTFVALIGAQSNLNVAVLIDYQKKDRQIIENLYKKGLLNKNSVFTYADYVEGTEADIEDMFDIEFYLNLVNAEFQTCVTTDNLPNCSPRIIKRLEQYFEEHPLSHGVSFNHYRPARYLSVNIDSLECKLAETQLDRFQKVFDDLNKLL